MIIETKDLLIRDSILTDIDYFYDWEINPEVTKYFSIREDQSKEEVIRKYIHDDENSRQKQFTICLKQEEIPIGRIVLADIEPEWKVEIWRIYIGETHWRGKGLGKQAMKAILELAFNDWNMERIYLDHYTGNPASQLYLALGFKYEGILRKNCRKNGKLYDVHIMSMLKDEYFDKYGRSLV